MRAATGEPGWAHGSWEPFGRSHDHKWSHARQVRAVDSYSVIGVGVCTSSGDGGVSIGDLDAVRVFSGAGVIAEEEVPLSTFERHNAAVVGENGDYEVFVVSEASSTRIRGDTYFSTRAKAWGTQLHPGEEHSQNCTFFIDPIATMA